MTPLLHPMLVNSPFDDPALFVDFLFSRRALLFDLGNLLAFPTRKLLRITHVFISHTHIDHFIGFDHLLRLCLGRDKRLYLFGPPGFVGQVGRRLSAYTWNLVYSYDTDFTIHACEIYPDGRLLCCEFHCLHAFKPEQEKEIAGAANGIIHEEEGLLVRVAFLDHKTISLAYCLEERCHVNVLKNRLDEVGLKVGPWLRELKDAVLRGAPDDTPIIPMLTTGGRGKQWSLGELRERVLTVSAGQKICYVTDAGCTPENAAAITTLAQGADYLFIESPFLHADVELAAERYHLTARQTGELARAAGVARVVPFHFSPRYTGREQELRDELERAWRGK